MAATSIPAKYIDEITDCPICYEIYTDPRVLPCIHTFCLKCITSWGKDKRQGDELACPLCRKTAKVPTGGLGELPKNLFVERLLEVRKISTCTPVSTTNKLCDVCCDDSRKSEDDKIITKRCTECQQNMCQQCAEYHQKVRLTKSHKLIDVGKEGVATEMLLSAAESFCEKHDDKRLELYCMECKLVVCMMCFVESHQTHKCGNIKSVAEELSKQIKDDVEDLAGNIEECDEMLATINKEDKYYYKIVGRTEQRICKRADELKQLIDEYKDSLLRKLRTRKKRHDEQIETMKYELNGQIMMMESFRKYSEELLDKGTACDIVREASDLRQRATELIEFNISELADLDDIISGVKLTFRNLLIDDIKNLFGELVALKNDDIDVVLPDSINPIHVLPTTGQSIRGVTSLRDEVYIVRYKSQQVHVYDVNTMSQKHTIQVAGLGNVFCGLAACAVNKCLYIADYTNTVVHRVELGSSYTVSSNWSVDEGPHGVSVNAKHNVLVAGHSTSTINEYTSHGALIRKICLELSISYPTFVIQLAGDQFGVTHCGANHGYSVVDSDGEVIINYGNSHGSGRGQVDYPYGVAITKRGLVFIADSNNNRIVVLNPKTLTVFNVGGLKDPTCLFLDESRDRLYIGECTGGRVIVIDEVNDLGFRVV